MKEKRDRWISDETKNWSISNLEMFIEKLCKEKEELDKNIALFERELCVRQQKEYARQMKLFPNNSIARNWL
jgi:hypothetical protein